MNSFSKELAEMDQFFSYTSSYECSDVEPEPQGAETFGRSRNSEVFGSGSGSD